MKATIPEIQKYPDARQKRLVFLQNTCKQNPAITKQIADFIEFMVVFSC
jgi:hypothetical protein